MRFLNQTVFSGCVLGAAMVLPASAMDTAAPEGVMVYVINIEDGATVTSPVNVKFGLSGMGVAPAGTEKENTGHHHIFLNTAPFDAAAMKGQGIPADDNHIHFGGGQTETTLDLPAGTRTIQLVLGDMNHIPHNPPVVSDRIEFTVE